MTPTGYDVAAVARLVAERHPGLAPDAVTRLAEAAKTHLAEMGELDAPELARRLLAHEPPVDASAASVVAAAAVEHCTDL